MSLIASSKSNAVALYANEGVTVYSTVLSKATLKELDRREDPSDGFGTQIAQQLADALPKVINVITKSRVVLKGKEEEAESRASVVKVYIPTQDGTVNGEEIDAGQTVYANATAGAVVESPSGKVLEFTFVVDKPWKGAQSAVQAPEVPEVQVAPEEPVEPQEVVEVVKKRRVKREDETPDDEGSAGDED